MGRYNGTFRYKPLEVLQRNQQTGYYSASGGSQWVDGGCCQIEKTIPASERIGADGKSYAYVWSVFIPASFVGSLEIGQKVEVVSEYGESAVFTVRGVERTRRYVELWG